MKTGTITADQVLIETLWNVKNFKQHVELVTLLVLIETLWNVKLFTRISGILFLSY